MSLFVLLPAGLAALAALLLPALIHLARRSEQRPTVFAALRWLRTKQRPRHRIRFDEWPLLLVRLLLVAATALLLARPVLEGADDLRPRVAVAPGLDVVALRAHVRAPADAHWLWLAPGFPALDGMPRAGGSVASLARELDATLPRGVPLTIVVPAVLDGVDGERPRLSRRVDWQIVPTAAKHAPRATPSPPTRLTVRYVPARREAARYMRATAIALAGSPAVDIAPPTAALPTTGALAWLVPGDVPAGVLDWARRGGVVLVDIEAVVDKAPAPATLVRDDGGHALVEGSAFGRGRLLRFSRPLTPEAIPELLDGTFPALVRDAITVSPPPPGRARAAEMLPRLGGDAFPIQPRDLGGVLALLAGMLFLVERWLATGRRGRAGA
ncbi:BatA domain-containing protein [Lysobacter humi (ex Lee et al. 2017)]